MGGKSYEKKNRPIELYGTSREQNLAGICERYIVILGESQDQIISSTLKSIEASQRIVLILN